MNRVEVFAFRGRFFISKAVRPKLNWTHWLRKQICWNLFENWPHIQQSFMLWFSFQSVQTICGDLWRFSASQAFAVRACLPSLFHSQPANKTPQYNHPLWPLNLTACLLNTSKIQRSKSFSLFVPLSSVPSPLYLYCMCVCPSSISPPAWAAVALSESPEFPIHCSVSAWKHHRCQLLG